MSVDHGDSADGGALGPDERAELEGLREEVARLRASTAPAHGGDGSSTRGTTGTRARTIGVVLVLVLACLLAPVSVVAVWAKSQVFDTDRYVQTVAPLADDPAVQQMVTERITAEIFSRIDVEGMTSEAITALQSTLPADVGRNLQGLSGVVANGVQSVVKDQVGNIVASRAFADAWAAANRAAHDQLVATLSGKSGAGIEVEGTTISVRLDTFASAVKQRLVDRGFSFAERIPQINAEFVLLESAQLPRLQRGFDLLNTLGLWLPFVTLGVFAAGVYLARDHRRAFVGAGLGLALSMLLVAVCLAVARIAYLDAVPVGVVPPDAAAVVYDTVVRFLREGIRAIGLAAVVVAVGAFLVGPARTSAAVRQAATAGAAAASRGLASLGVEMSPISHRVGPHARWVRVVLVLGAFLAFLVPAYPTPKLVLWIVVGLLASLLLLQVLSSSARRPATSS